MGTLISDRVQTGLERLEKGVKLGAINKYQRTIIKKKVNCGKKVVRAAMLFCLESVLKDRSAINQM